MSNRVVFPEFEIVSNPTIHIGQIKQRRFNLIDRDDEPSVENIVDDMTYFDGHKNREMTRQYIVNYIRSHKKFANLRAAIQESCPEYEDILNKLLVLK